MKEDVLAWRREQVENCCPFRQINYQQVIHPDFSGVIQEGTLTVGMKKKGSWQVLSHDISPHLQGKVLSSFPAFTRKLCIEVMLNNPGPCSSQLPP